MPRTIPRASIYSEALPTARLPSKSAEYVNTVRVKAFVTLAGNLASVQAAIDAGAQIVGQKEMPVNKAVIPSPRPELFDEMIRGFENSSRVARPAKFR